MGWLIYDSETKTYFGILNTGSQNKKHLKDYTYSTKERCENHIKKYCKNKSKFKVVELK